jgi:transcriptional regulator with XRE-family HTH domain
MVGFGVYLHTLRKKEGLTGQELADKSGVSKTYIWQLENEHRGAPKPGKLAKLAPALGVSYNEMMAAAGYVDIPKGQTGIIESACLADEYINKGMTEAQIRRILDSFIAALDEKVVEK